MKRRQKIQKIVIYFIIAALVLSTVAMGMQALTSS
ncbi:stressosome-associated protein Prli42 [Marinicrinis lubricantis]|uniref:Stressosome-associated protein Prli42 n=1 Tax=Marinicrinis lubricantis TaxID=2086470 RepID=A0ABW1ISM2_9BACL